MPTVPMNTTSVSRSVMADSSSITDPPILMTTVLSVKRWMYPSASIRTFALAIASSMASFRKQETL